VKQWLAAGRVQVNGVVVRHGGSPVAPSDRIVLGPPGRAATAPPLPVVHQDDHLVVIDKPTGLLTIATERERERTAYRLLRDWLAAEGRGRVFIVHRLDRETSGLLVFARTAAAKAALQAQFEARAVERVYVARVEGVVRRPAGRLVSRVAGKEAISRYRVLERFHDATRLEVALETGRRGQIRAQLAWMGHPVVGDRAHGSRQDPLRRVCLHATRLGFEHPAGGRVVFDSPARF
jgi:23S rRNA pseudouridine1911/1915/1917 synthase